MGVLEDIQAAVADGTLTDDQRRRLIRRLRAQEWERLQAALPIERTFGRGNRSVTVTIASIGRDEGMVVLGGFDDRDLHWNTDGGRVEFWPVQVANPPLLVADPAGPIARTDSDGTTFWRLDVAEALRLTFVDVLADCVRQL